MAASTNQPWRNGARSYTHAPKISHGTDPMGDHVGVQVVVPEPQAPSRPAPGRQPVSDARLVAQIRGGNERAFELLYDRYHRELLAFCRHMLGSREEAEDVLQQVMVATHRQLVTSPAELALRPWLYAVARHRCISILRGRRESFALDDVPEPSSEGLDAAAEVEQRDDLRAMLSDIARLPDDQRAALLLAELGALSHDEISEALEVRREKVKALVFQARESLAGWRSARETDCAEIRAQLANLSGGALRRGPLRKHIDVCIGCRAFRAQVRRQREALALLLPVLPTVALKANVLGAVAASSSAIAASAPVGAGIGGAVAAGQATGGGAVGTLSAGGLSGGGAAAGGVGSGAAAATGVGSAAAGSAGTAAAGGLGGVAAGGVSSAAGGLAARALAVVALAGAAGGGYAVVDPVSAPRIPPLRQSAALTAKGQPTPVPAASAAAPMVQPAAAVPGVGVTPVAVAVPVALQA